jgi:hypothetical protein
MAGYGCLRGRRSRGLGHPGECGCPRASSCPCRRGERLLQGLLPLRRQLGDLVGRRPPGREDSRPSHARSRIRGAGRDRVGDPRASRESRTAESVGAGTYRCLWHLSRCHGNYRSFRVASGQHEMASTCRMGGSRPKVAADSSLGLAAGTWFRHPEPIRRVRPSSTSRSFTRHDPSRNHASRPHRNRARNWPVRRVASRYSRRWLDRLPAISDEVDALAFTRRTRIARSGRHRSNEPPPPRLTISAIRPTVQEAGCLGGVYR